MTKVLKTAQRLYLEGTNGEAVLVQHGYNGYPGELYDLARRINKEGYTVVVPRLPGHGTNGKDFRQTNWRIWLEYYRTEYLNLQAQYEKITVLGLSMGGVLSLIAAAEFNPEKAILLAPAMAIANKIFYLTPILKFIMPKIKRNRPPESGEDEDRIVLAEEYWNHFYSGQISGVNRLMRTAKSRLGEVECPVYFMLSEKDKTVPLSAGDVIEKGLKISPVKLILKNSPHVVFEGPEKEFAINQVVSWLEE